MNITTLGPFEPPTGLVEAVRARVERYALPDLPPDIAEAWRSGMWSWALHPNDDTRTIAVDVFATTLDGGFQIARLDGATVGFVVDEAGAELAIHDYHTNVRALELILAVKAATDELYQHLTGPG